tara:strand:+ start:436 stop:825 length:390 start_codon:yes stop_codon:yes gene_type:complete
MKYFQESELACPTTGIVQLEEGFANDLDELREAYGHPIVVTSACRTAEHNEWLQSRGYPASNNSLHLIDNEKYGTDTCAIDMKRPDGVLLVKLFQTALSLGWTIGFAKNFVHLDKREKYTDLTQIIYSY